MFGNDNLFGNGYKKEMDMLVHTKEALEAGQQ
jgi:hypothetical protein